ncbi:MAG: cytochrome c biogenesis protein CcsA [Bacteroidaceae bacterium]|nr:cytochrome c biogenesis protein CcsA [Bacteroidaceae bacterium]
MVTWNNFIYFALPTVLMAFAGAVCAIRSQQRSRWAIILTIISIAIFISFVSGMWVSLERPPLRTMGETRLWYSLFMLVSGLFTYIRWNYRWILSFSTLMATVFIAINIFNPDIHDRTLMPALQSIWFIPHVTVYMFSYSLLGVSFILAIYSLFKHQNSIFAVIDTLVYAGIAFFTVGMLTGAIWAKDAWGHYWSWDPKETWAFITWILYQVYIHLRFMGRVNRKWLSIVLIFSFLSLQMCWYGVNYLPQVRKSIHTYNNN